MWKSILNQNNGEAILDIDAVIDFKDITKKLHTDLKRFAPLVLETQSLSSVR